jgi:hypothetical protein
MMAEKETKPLNWTPQPGIGYVVVRRADGGMQVTFIDVSPATLNHWREFALSHLFDSDRLTTNLYDLRAIHQLSSEAMQYALEVNADPSVRNLRVAVVVSSDQVRDAVVEIAALSPSGVEMDVFTDIEAAEEWLARPLTLVL